MGITGNVPHVFCAGAAVPDRSRPVREAETKETARMAVLVMRVMCFMVIEVVLRNIFTCVSVQSFSIFANVAMGSTTFYLDPDRQQRYITARFAIFSFQSFTVHH